MRVVDRKQKKELIEQSLEEIDAGEVFHADDVGNLNW